METSAQAAPLSKKYNKKGNRFFGSLKNTHTQTYPASICCAFLRKTAGSSSHTPQKCPLFFFLNLHPVLRENSERLI